MEGEDERQAAAEHVHLVERLVLDGQHALISDILPKASANDLGYVRVASTHLAGMFLETLESPVGKQVFGGEGSSPSLWMNLVLNEGEEMQDGGLEPGTDGDAARRGRRFVEAVRARTSSLLSTTAASGLSGHMSFLQLGAALVDMFVQENWTGPPLETEYGQSRLERSLPFLTHGGGAGGESV